MLDGYLHLAWCAPGEAPSHDPLLCLCCSLPCCNRQNSLVLSQKPRSPWLLCDSHTTHYMQSMEILPALPSGYIENNLWEPLSTSKHPNSPLSTLLFSSWSGTAVSHMASSKTLLISLLPTLLIQSLFFQASVLFKIPAQSCPSCTQNPMTSFFQQSKIPNPFSHLQGSVRSAFDSSGLRGFVLAISSA